MNISYSIFILDDMRTEDETYEMNPRYELLEINTGYNSLQEAEKDIDNWIVKDSPSLYTILPIYGK